MDEPRVEDVVIIGAGLSGVGAACRLRIHQPGMTFRIFEARERLGGTWDLFRYPGVRSDSDMFTLGYPFRPWSMPKSLTDAASIKGYIEDTAREYGVLEKIEYKSRVVELSFNSDEALWTAKIQHADGSVERVQSRFVMSCCGYYDYEGGHAPSFDGEDSFAGDILQPQFWPENFDYAGKKVVVIGSGATAVTLVPAMAGTAGHVTMLQRSPTYIASLPAVDPWFNTVHKLFPSMVARKILRLKRMSLGTLGYQLARRYPEWFKKQLEKGIKEQLGDKVPLDPHFKPTYQPWDQRLCLVPDNDLFIDLKEGRASVVTDEIARFTENGLELKSGEFLEADVVVKATGLKLLPIGGMDVFVDGETIKLSQTFNYKGFMFSHLPNFAVLMGYTNASWTLKTDLACRYFCKLLDVMKEKGADIMVPDYGSTPPEAEPLLDLKSGYVERSIHMFPNQGSERPWRNHQNYMLDYMDMKFGKLDDGVMQFRKRTNAVPMLEAAE
ncbi:MAG: NAD(P)/FAD-dependent oxidoreductase [Pseudomonadota bacterium]